MRNFKRPSSNSLFLPILPPLANFPSNNTTNIKFSEMFSSSTKTLYLASDDISAYFGNLYTKYHNFRIKHENKS